MGGELLSVFKQFSIDNILGWVRDVLDFFSSPRKYLDKVSAQSNSDIFSQFFFYFISYTLFHIFYPLDFKFDALIKPAVINLVLTIPQIFFYSASSKLILKKFNFKKILILIVSLHFFISPFVIIFYSLFINLEDYTYKIILNTIVSLSSVYVLFGFGFIIEKKFLNGLKVVLLNYILISFTYLLWTNVNIDEFGGKAPFVFEDEIYDEYAELERNLKYKEKVPVQRLILLYQDKFIKNTYTIQEVVGDTVSHGSDKTLELYESAIDSNLSYLEATYSSLKFHRNKMTSEMWKEHFELLKQTIDSIQSQNIEDLNLNNFYLVSNDSINKIKIYGQQLHVAKFVASQFYLKKYNNSLYRTNLYSNNILEYRYIITFLPYYILDNLLFDIMDKDEQQPYSDKFIDL